MINSDKIVTEHDGSQWVRLEDAVALSAASARGVADGPYLEGIGAILAKSGSVVTIECESSDDADDVFNRLSGCECAATPEVALAGGPDFEAEGKKVNDLYWRETPAYIAMMGVVRGYVLGRTVVSGAPSDAAPEVERLREIIHMYVDSCDIRPEHQALVDSCNPDSLRTPPAPAGEGM